jgi:hypothetical protein
MGGAIEALLTPAQALRRLGILLESGEGLPHSATLARIPAGHSFREVVECPESFGALRRF